LCIVTGILIGVVNGISVTVIGINALITMLAMLAMLAILRGLALVLAGGQTLLLPDFGAIGNARPLFDIPAPVFLFIGVTIITALAMRYTVFGRSMYAIGANPVAARLAGIKTKRAVFTGFILSGLAVVLGASSWSRNSGQRHRRPRRAWSWLSSPPSSSAVPAWRAAAEPSSARFSAS